MGKDIKEVEKFELKICRLCHMGIYKEHVEFCYLWKCETCGHTIFEIKFLHPNLRELAEHDRFRKRPF